METWSLNKESVLALFKRIFVSKQNNSASSKNSFLKKANDQVYAWK